MKKLNEAALQIGDIILTTSGEKLSKGIRIVTASDISHAMLYVMEGSVVDSTTDGVHARSTQRLLWEDDHAVHVLRAVNGLAQIQSVRIVEHARAKIGTRYSIKQAALAVTKRRLFHF